MNHTDDILQYLKLLRNSDHFHALIVRSPPGWAKSTTINEALRKLKADFASIGSYSTPLYFYNALCDNENKIVVLDDCAGLFGNITAMSILKAATWPVDGGGMRRVTWGSTSERMRKPAVDFQGKLILLTNVLPQGNDTDAFLNRCIFFDLNFNKETVAKLLLEGAKNKKYYPNTARAVKVAKFLIENLDKRDYEKFSLRDLRKGYELASVSPRWQEMFEKLLPKVEPEEFVRKLALTKMTAEDQAREFIRKTGLGRRKFFLIRSELELAKPQLSNILKKAAKRREANRRAQGLSGRRVGGG